MANYIMPEGEIKLGERLAFLGDVDSDNDYS